MVSAPTIKDLGEGVKKIQNKLVCDSIRSMAASDTPPSLAKVEAVLAEMDLELNEEIGKRIASFGPVWFEAKHVIVSLETIEYDDFGVSFPLNSEGVSIPSRLLPFDSSAVIDSVKTLLEGDLEAFIDKKFYFQWNTEPEQLTVEHKYILRKKIKVDETSLRTLKKIEDLRMRLAPSSADSFIGSIFGLAHPKRFEFKTAIPKELLKKDKYYNTKCIDVLMAMAETCYITDRDFWFKVGDVLIWEEPRYSKATYIFKWPEEPLRIFIFRIWISRLLDIRMDPESGYIDRANHEPYDPDDADKQDVSDWKKNLETKIQDEEAAFTLGTVLSE